MPDGGCDHDWQPVAPLRVRTAGDVVDPSSKQATNRGSPHDLSGGLRCARNGCWRGELGQEPESGLFVDHLVEVFRDVKRVLRADGTCFLNIGDSYAGSWGARGRGPATNAARPDLETKHGLARPALGVPAKNMLLVPARLALALQADGWIVRSVIPWVKWRSAMPESVTDRLTVSHEWWLVLAKSQRYYWDADAVRKPYIETSLARFAYEYRAYGPEHPYALKHGAQRDGGSIAPNPHGRNLRTGDVFLAGLDVLIDDTRRYLAHLEHVQGQGGPLLDPEGEPLALLLDPEPSSEAHYAAYGLKLVTPFLLAGTSEHGVCGACGAPYRRLVERQSLERYELDPADPRYRPARYASKYDALKPGGTGMRHSKHTPLGWERTCRCPTEARVPATVLDPFAGSGSTLVAALRQGRRALGIELNPEYAAIAQRRCDAAAAQPRLPLEAV